MQPGSTSRRQFLRAASAAVLPLPARAAAEAVGPMKITKVDRKVEAIAQCKSQGGGNNGSLLRTRLEREQKRLAILGDDDSTADREYIRQFLLDDGREAGKPYSLAYAERFYYMDQRQPSRSKVDDYVDKHAVRL